MSAPDPGIVVVVRHGATAWSVEGRHTGRRELPLNDAGRAQAGRAGAWLAGHRFATVWVSPQERARETCRLAGFAADATEHPDLVEWDYGDYEGLTDDEVRRERPGWSLFRDGAPGGEQPEEVVARVDRVLSALRETAGPRLVFSHGKTLRVMAARWLGQSATFAGSLPFQTAAIGILDVDGGWPALRLWNFQGEVPQLAGAG